MTLQASGVIGVNNINVELGRASNANTNLNETACRNLAGVPSGAIALSNFYGKSLFSATWSGSSITSNGSGISTSGSLFRGAVTGSYGPWLSAYTDGTFQVGDSTVSGAGISVPQNNALRAVNFGYATGWVYFGLVPKFTGSSTKTYLSTTVTLETSGGLLRFVLTGNAGGWIGLN